MNIPNVQVIHYSFHPIQKPRRTETSKKEQLRRSEHDPATERELLQYLGGLFREEGRTEAAVGEITRRCNGGGEWWDSCRAAKEEVRDVGDG